MVHRACAFFCAHAPLCLMPLFGGCTLKDKGMHADMQTHFALSGCQWSLPPLPLSATLLRGVTDMHPMTDAQKCQGGEEAGKRSVRTAAPSHQDLPPPLCTRKPLPVVLLLHSTSVLEKRESSFYFFIFQKKMVFYAAVELGGMSIRAAIAEGTPENIVERKLVRLTICFKLAKMRICNISSSKNPLFILSFFLLPPSPFDFLYLLPACFAAVLQLVQARRNQT